MISYHVFTEKSIKILFDIKKTEKTVLRWIDILQVFSYNEEDILLMVGRKGRMTDHHIPASGRLEERIQFGPLYVGMEVRDGNHINMPDFHYHSSYEIFYVKDGTVDFIIGNENYTIVDGNLLVIPPFVAHRSMYTNSKITCRYEVSVSDSQVSEHMRQILQHLSGCVCFTVSLKYQESIVKLLQKMCEERATDKKYSEDLCLAYLQEFLILLYRHAVPKPFAGRPQKILPQKIMEYISENYHRNITVAELADTFHVCESSVYKTFKRHTGLKITDYLNFTRIMHAERLMREHTYSLSEIAYQCGFNDCNYFSAVFKKYKNITPGKYMRKYGKSI